MSPKCCIAMAGVRGPPKGPEKFWTLDALWCILYISRASPLHFFLKKKIRLSWHCQRFIGLCRILDIETTSNDLFSLHRINGLVSRIFQNYKEHINYYSLFTNNSGSHSFRVRGLQPQTNERMFKVALHTCFCMPYAGRLKLKQTKIQQQKSPGGFHVGFQPIF